MHDKLKEAQAYILQNYEGKTIYPLNFEDERAYFQFTGVYVMPPNDKGERFGKINMGFIPLDEEERDFMFTVNVSFAHTPEINSELKNKTDIALQYVALKVRRTNGGGLEFQLVPANVEVKNGLMRWAIVPAWHVTPLTYNERPVDSKLEPHGTMIYSTVTESVKVYKFSIIYCGDTEHPAFTLTGIKKGSMLEWKREDVTLMTVIETIITKCSHQFFRWNTGMSEDVLLHRAEIVKARFLEISTLSGQVFEEAEYEQLIMTLATTVPAKKGNTEMAQKLAEALGAKPLPPNSNPLSFW